LAIKKGNRDGAEAPFLQRVLLKLNIARVIITQVNPARKKIST